jgi:hypothetical protein
MAYGDWSPEFQDTWNNLPIDEGNMTAEELDWAEYTFELGFMSYSGEQSRAEMRYAREEFFAAVDIDEDQFDWEGWREAMGYD